MPDPDDDNAFPVLTDVLVPGKPQYKHAGKTTRPVALAESFTGDALIPLLTDVLIPGIGERAQSVAPQLAEPANEALAHRDARRSGLEQDAARSALDADLIAERLRKRVESYLIGEGRDLIEARCRDALQDYSHWLVNQVTREVALALEMEVAGWVREAVQEALA